MIVVICESTHGRSTGYKTAELISDSKKLNIALIGITYLLENSRQNYR